MKKFILGIMLISLTFGSDQIPGAPQKKPILLKNGIIHTVSGDVKHGWDLLFEYGKIVEIAENIAASEFMEIKDLDGKHVYPGFILSATVMGLIEIRAVRSTNDLNESGQLNPNVKTNVSYNPDSELIPVARSNGILLANVVPTAGLIAGQSSLMMMDGWTWEDATLEAPTALQINWPSMDLGINDPGEKKKALESRAEKLREIDDLFDQVRAYAKKDGAKKKTADLKAGHDLKLASMVPYINKKKPIIVRADDVRQIEAAVHWAKKQNVSIVILGGMDAWRISDLLRKNNVPVIFENVLAMPQRRYENYDQPFRTPIQLYEAGVKFSIITPATTMEAPHSRNLPYEAAMATAYGLPKAEALRSITLSAAEILGVADRVGSLDAGKDATIFISDGDALDIRSHVLEAWIQGRTVDLNNRHKTLYKKYQEKYRQLGRIE